MKTDAHEEIIKEYKLVEMMGEEPNFVRVEISPENGDMTIDLDKWVYKLDQDIKPRWYEKENVEARTRTALKEWADARRFVSRDAGTITDGSIYLFGSSTVVAMGSSKVVAMGSSTVEARGSSKVEARDSSTVEAWGSSTVEAWGSSTVEAWDSSKVEAMDSSKVVAMGSSTVEAMDSSTVVAMGSSKVVAMGSSTVEAMDSSKVEAMGSSTVEAKEQGIYFRNGEIHAAKGAWKFVEEG
jgi:hypothetical protein